MTEVCNCGGGTATAKRRLGCAFGVPPPTYIKGEGEEVGPRRERAMGESYLDS